MTQAVTEQAVRVLCCDIDYTVPAQDLRIDRRRMPTGPRSGIVLTRVRRRSQPD